MAKTQRGRKRRAREGKKAPDRPRDRSLDPAPDERREIAVPVWAIALLGFLVHLVFLQDNASTAFFFGDGLYYLQKARHLVEGTLLDADLPFHPPLPSFLLVPLWWLVPPAKIVLAAKVSMAVIQAATYALVYRLLRGRVPWAAPVCLLLPLQFGELLLSATPSSEAPYRLLLAGLLVLGTRWPVLGGVLHALAALTRAEHAILGLGLAAFGFARRKTRRFTAWTAAAALVCLLPYTAMTAVGLSEYNERHADEIPEPLPTFVPVSFYGPLNFALAQTEDGIHFSRRGLPPSRGEAAALDPLHPTHNAYIVHGYRIGLERIAESPGRFLKRSGRKLVHSLRAFVQGFTWRDLPKGPTWHRQPVDMAYSSAPLYELVSALLMLLGAWHLRADRRLLFFGGALIAYRLALNVLFFPYLRGMTIATPFAVVLLAAGIAFLARRHASRVLLAIVLVLGLYHFTTGFGERPYQISGERDARGVILEDRAVTLQWAGEE